MTISLGDRVTLNGRAGKVVHTYHGADGTKYAFVRWDATGRKGQVNAADLRREGSK